MLKNIKKILGVIGGGLVILGVFLPILNLGLFGKYSYFNLGINGKIIFALAIISIILSLFGRFFFLIITSVGIFSVFAYDVWKFFKLKKNLTGFIQKFEQKNPNNILIKLAKSAFQSFDVGWGWIFIVLGAFILLILFFVPVFEKKLSASQIQK